MSKLRARLTFANVVSLIALFVALGGSSYAALKVTSRNVPKDALTGADIKNLTGKDVRNNGLTGADVKNLTSGDVTDSSLLAEDFASGQLAAGPQGERGPQGAKGDRGEPGDDGTPGAPGTARAYGEVSSICTGTPTEFCPVSHNKGIAYVAHVGTGIYCVRVNGITPADAPAILSARFNPRLVTWTLNVGCAESEYEVRTQFASGSATDTSFVIAIP